VKDDPIEVAPSLYRVVLENERVRVLAFRGQPGASWGLHAHPNMVVVSLSSYVVRNVVPGDEPSVRQTRHGEVAWIPARSHTGENVGDTEMECVLVELKPNG
jgi:quercetin dioxygenase-like cupin family protein